MSNLKIKCHIDGDYCYPDTMFMDYRIGECREKQCLECPKRWENYYKILDDSVKSAEKDPDSNIHLIRKEAVRTFNNGGFIKWEDDVKSKEDVGFLIGATTTLEDYYWLWIDANLKISYTSCCMGYKDLDELTEIPDFCSDLSKLVYDRKEELKRLVDESLERSKYDKMITEINIKI